MKLSRLLTKDGILFAPPFARLKARIYFACIGWRYGDGLRGAIREWRRIK